MGDGHLTLGFAPFVGLALGLVASACAGGTTLVEIPEEDGKIVGRVIDTEGSPVAGATIFVNPFAPNRTTNATGHFEVTDLELEREYLVTATKPGYGSSSVQVRLTRAQRLVSVELTIVRLAAAAGRG